MLDTLFHIKAVLGLSHFNKKVDAGMINRTIGSRAWSAVPRISWGIRTEQVEDEEGNKSDTENRFLLNIKCNIGVKPRGLKFSIGEDGRVICDGERVNMTMDDTGETKKLPVNEAMDWLVEYLGNKAMTSTIIFEEGGKLGFCRATLFRAKDQLNIKATKQGFGKDGIWFWEFRNV